MIIWRALFDAIHIPWRDRGSNCSRGHINVSCCWCGKMDPSYHLTINEENGAYFCLRTPDKVHSGRSLPWLLLGLGVHPREIDGLIEEHSDRRMPIQLVSSPARVINWDRFDSAADHDGAREYLSITRHYSDPLSIITTFGLRFTKVGRFAWRILMPLTSPGDRDTVLAFTGRAIRGQEPRYLTNDPMEGSLYLPPVSGPTAIIGILGTALPAEKKLHLGQLMRSHQSAIIFEGPFDALTLAAAEPDLRLPAGTVLYVPDADQSVSDTYRLIEELQGIPGVPLTQRLELPRGFGDVGEMAGDPGELKRWIRTYTFPSGMDRSKATPVAS